MNNEYTNISKTLSRIPSGLFIVAMNSNEGPFAFLASFVQQVSLNPPRLVIGVANSRVKFGNISDGKLITLHILEQEHIKVVKDFSKNRNENFDPLKNYSFIDNYSDTIEIKELPLRIISEVNKVVDIEADHKIIVCNVLRANFKEKIDHTKPSPWVNIRNSGLKY